MLSKAQIKFINSLHQKKYRQQNEMFIAEGSKIVLDFLKNGAKPYLLIASKTWINENAINNSEDIYTINNETNTKCRIIETEENIIKKCSALSTPTNILAVFKYPESKIEDIENNLSIVLDNVQDPGNLGTIIRTAEWFGIKNIICSKGTVDVYNPKVIQATMGAILGVNITYTDIKDIISKHASPEFPIYGTYMEGENLYTKKLSNKGFIVMGNEGKGISKEITRLITEKISIPNARPGKGIAESLNVAIACSIICSEFFRINSYI
jgi:TrmH family RNA methyltransferase